MISFAKQTRGLVFCLGIAFLIFGSCGSSIAQSQPQADLPQKNVLILYSEDKSHPAHELTDRGIRSVFRSNNLFEVRLYNEYLDRSRFKDPAITHAFADYLRRKYAGLKIDTIIAVYPTVVDFLIKEAIDLFSETPIVAQVTRVYAENLEHSPWRRFITGTIIGDNVSGVLDAALQIGPGTKRVALVGGASPNDIYTEQLFRKSLEPYLKRLEIVDLTRLPMQEILSRVGSLPPDTIVLFSNMFMDGAGQNFVPREAAALISRAANAPVFGLFDSYLGYGIVGGRLVSFEEHGREAAAQALHIMGGQSPASIPFGGEQAYVSAYDGRQLRRWNLSEDDLPEGSIVVNRESTLWDFRYYIMGFLAFFLAETALIVLLIVQRRRKNIAELSLKKAEEKYRDIFEGALEGIFETSPEGRLLTANAALARMLGYDSPDEVTSTIQDLATQVWANPDERAQYIRLLEKQGIVLNYECQLRRKDEKMIWVSMNTRRVCSPDGQTLYFSGFLEDITERKQTEKALEERLRFESLLSDFSARFVNISPEQVDGEIENALKLVLEFFQVDRCGLIRTLQERTAWQITHVAVADDQVLNVPVGAVLSRTIHPWAYEMLFEKRQIVAFSSLDDLPPEAHVDRQAWTERGTRSTLLIPIGESVNYVITINSLKSERVWPEEFIPGLRLLGEIFVNALERKKAEAAVSESEAKYRSLFESMMDGYVLAGMDGTILQYNEAYREMTGYSPDELLRLTYRDITPEKWHDVEQKIIEEQLLPRGYSEIYEKEYRKKDGTVFPIELRTFLLKDETGSNIGMWAIVRDITDHKQMESEARKLKDNLAHVTRVSTMGGLTGALAHEINQPLAAILSNAQAAQRFLSQDNPDMQEITEILRDIIRDDNRAAEVIRKTRSLLKKEESRYESQDLNDIIEEILNVIRNDTALMTVSIEKEMDPSLPSIWGDRIQLQQVILNLVLNAAEAMKEAGPDLRRLIIGTSKHDDRFAKVSIRDFGPGIRENPVSRLFDPFYTTKSGGMGMGLAISKDIVKSHKGEIQAMNNPDRGATFSFTVPFDSGVRP